MKKLCFVFGGGQEIAAAVKAAEERTRNLVTAESECQLAELKSQMEMNAAKTKAASLEEMREFHEQTVKGLRQELEEENKRAIQAEKAKERRILEDSTADLLSKAKAEREASLQEQEQKLRDEFSGVLDMERQQRQREKEQLIDEYENLLSKQSKVNERQVGELEESLKSSLASQKQRMCVTFEAEKDEIEKKFSKELFYLKENHECEQSRLAQEMQKALEDKEAKMQDACSRLKTEHEAEMKTLSEEFDEKISQLKVCFLPSHLKIIHTHFYGPCDGSLACSSQASNAKEMEEERAKAQEFLEAANKESEAGLAETVKKMKEETRVSLENQESRLEQLYKQREEELQQSFNLEKENQAQCFSEDKEKALNAAAEDFATKLSSELQKLAAEKDEREERLLEELKKSASG